MALFMNQILAYRISAEVRKKHLHKKIKPQIRVYESGQSVQSTFFKKKKKKVSIEFLLTFF